MNRCTRCDRILKAPAASVITKAGSAVYGPKCAVLMGLIKPTGKTRTRTPRKARATPQMPLGFDQ